MNLPGFWELSLFIWVAHWAFGMAFGKYDPEANARLKRYKASDYISAFLSRAIGAMALSGVVTWAASWSEAAR